MFGGLNNKCLFGRRFCLEIGHQQNTPANWTLSEQLNLLLGVWWDQVDCSDDFCVYLSRHFPGAGNAQVRCSGNFCVYFIRLCHGAGNAQYAKSADQSFTLLIPTKVSPY